MIDSKRIKIRQDFCFYFFRNNNTYVHSLILGFKVIFFIYK